MGILELAGLCRSPLEQAGLKHVIGRGGVLQHARLVNSIKVMIILCGFFTINKSSHMSHIENLNSPFELLEIYYCLHVPLEVKLQLLPKYYLLNNCQLLKYKGIG